MLYHTIPYCATTYHTTSKMIFWVMPGWPTFSSLVLHIFPQTASPDWEKIISLINKGWPAVFFTWLGLAGQMCQCGMWSKEATSASSKMKITLCWTNVGLVCGRNRAEQLNPNVNREDKQALINFTILTSPVRRADKYCLKLNKISMSSFSCLFLSLPPPQTSPLLSGALNCMILAFDVQ